MLRGNTRLHRRVGAFGIWYGFLVLAMGLVVSFAAPLIHLAAGEWDMERAAGFLLIPLGDMALFGGFFIAAVVYRRTPEIHKRLIVLATVALLFAAVGRMHFIQSRSLLVLIWLSPVLVAMAYEAIRRRRLDRVYGRGLVILLVGLSRVAVAQWEPWLRVARGTLRSMM
jgi:prepilin signal peptidase PulO-like enzyme (type II secretory pathway)